MKLIRLTLLLLLGGVLMCSPVSLNAQQNYPQDFPSSTLPNGLFGTMILIWRANTKAVTAELKSDPTLASKYRKTNGRVFGSRATLAPSANILCVENESGQLTFYDLKSFEQRGQLTFADQIRLVRFSADGNRLAVLTANQVVYTFNLGAVLANQQH